MSKALSSTIKELRIHLCQSSESSQGVREFVTKFYPQLKSANPSLPILVREVSGIEPKVYARYDFGVEAKSELSNLTSQQVLDSLNALQSYGDQLSKQQQQQQ